VNKLAAEETHRHDEAHADKLYRRVQNALPGLYTPLLRRAHRLQAKDDEHGDAEPLVRVQCRQRRLSIDAWAAISR
jgi:hypothetical protein